MNHSTRIAGHVLICLALSSTIGPRTSSAGWVPDGIPICSADSAQGDQFMVPDPLGGAVISWEDERNSGTDRDIYAQRVNISGELQWNPEGVAICTAIKEQSFQWGAMIADGEGGAYIGWADARSGVDNYAQHVDGSGLETWTHDGTPISAAAMIQEAPNLIPDGSGGLIAAWRDLRNGGPPDIYAQRLNSQGESQWIPDGTPICLASGHQWYPHLCTDEAGGAIIAWDDPRIDSSMDIFAQRINANGVAQWGPTQLPIVTAPGMQDLYSEPIPDGSGGAILFWRDARNGVGTDDIYAQHVSLSGSLLWAASGIPVCAASGAQERDQGISDGEGGCIIVWQDSRTGTDLDIYAQRVDGAGNLLWQSQGTPVCNEPGDQLYPSMATNGHGGAFIVWEDLRDPSSDIYLQEIESSGSVVGPQGGYLLCGAAGDQVGTQVTATGTGSAIVTWVDYRSGEADIYAQRWISPVSSVPVSPGVVRLELSPNYPNPFSGATTLRFAVPVPGTAKITVFDVSGRPVFRNNYSMLTPGWGQVSFPGLDDRGRPLPTGVYMYQIVIGAEAVASRMIIRR